jgi:D-3-phosphoglycerate dehydrogenase / 2-oxoglutarate reductase
MYNIWFEKAVATDYASMFEGIANGISPGDKYAEDSLHQIDIAHGAMAGGVSYNSELMDRASNLLIVSRIGIGYDKVDIEAATAHGIAVCNTPDAPTISTAECALTLMMGVARNFKKIQKDLVDMLESGEKRNIWGTYVAYEMSGKQLGLVGLGRIGGHVAKVTKAMGMKVATYDPFITAERAAEIGVQKIDSLEELLGMSDIVSLHLPLNPETRKIMNAERFAQMKKGAVFINASRGGHVDESALVDALDSGHLFGAGLDVTDPEPPLASSPLLNRENVMITPHIASATFAGRRKMMTGAMDQILQVLRGEKPDNLINPEAWDRVLERWQAMQ